MCLGGGGGGGVDAYRNPLKRAGVEGTVNLGCDVAVVVVEVFQPAALGPEGSHCFVESQGQGPNGIIGQRGLLEASRLLWVLAAQLRHQLGQELLGSLQDSISSISRVRCVLISDPEDNAIAGLLGGDTDTQHTQRYAVQGVDSSRNSCFVLEIHRLREIFIHRLLWYMIGRNKSSFTHI